jgi:hypothetical protein
MSIRVIGAGLGRTGTTSLKLALEKLLGSRCYHMYEVIEHPEHVPIWRRALAGEAVDWPKLFNGYHACVDWPVAAFWRELSGAFPDAHIVLSLRDPESWWQSVSTTIFPTVPKSTGDFRLMLDALFAQRFTAELTDRAACIAKYTAHVDQVRRDAPAHRLIEWRAQQGWGPLCKALGLPVPNEPFPHENTADSFRSRQGAAASPAAARGD